MSLRFILHAYIFIFISNYTDIENEEGVLTLLTLSQTVEPGSSLPLRVSMQRQGPPATAAGTPSVFLGCLGVPVVISGVHHR